MRILNLLRRHWRTLLAGTAALAALALVWATRDGPLQPTPFVRVDALSAFFSFALLGGVALAAIARPSSDPLGWRAPVAIALLLGAWSTTLTPVIATMYLLVALVGRPTSDQRPTTNDQRPTTDERRDDTSGLAGRARQVWQAIRSGLAGAPDLVAAGSLAVGYGALAARGALRYDARTAGTALDSFAFWFVLLAAAIPISVLAKAPQSQSREPRTNRRTTNDERRNTQHATRNTQHATRVTVHPLIDLYRFAWLYPLARLYSLGPWNTGWSFATLLLGGGVALWAALAALTRPSDRRDLAPRSFLGLALAGLGLGTGAGIAAGCYGVLTYLVLDIAAGAKETRRQGGNESGSEEISLSPHLHVSLSPWLLSGAIPLTAPFVAAWMLVGASVAGGVALLAGAAWLVVLLSGLTAALSGAQAEADRRALLLAAGVSVALGVGAPLFITALIQPVIEQLQGGLAPYGDVNIWPWVGLATIDAAHTPVTTLPSIAVAAFMLVLSALVYLIARLRGVWAPENPPTDGSVTELDALLAGLRDEVPWLGALAPRPTEEERRVDGE